MKNNKGNITLLSLFLCTGIFSLGSLLILNLKFQNKKIAFRSRHYLCFSYLNKESYKYLKRMAYFNQAIQTAYLAKLVPATRPAAEVTHRTLKRAQDFYHFSKMKNLFKNKYCPSLVINSYLINLPYKTQFGFLTRGPNGVPILRKRKWRSHLLAKKRTLFHPENFILEARFSLKSAYHPFVQIRTKEIGKLGMLSSKL